METSLEKIETGHATFKNRNIWSFGSVINMSMEQSFLIDVWDRDTNNGKMFPYTKFKTQSGQEIYYISETDCYFTKEAFSEIKIDD